MHTSSLVIFLLSSSLFSRFLTVSISLSSSLWITLFCVLLQYTPSLPNTRWECFCLFTCFTGSHIMNKNHAHNLKPYSLYTTRFCCGTLKADCISSVNRLLCTCISSDRMKKSSGFLISSGQKLYYKCSPCSASLMSFHSVRPWNNM